ncbi:dynein beta chain, ciliary-like isoform X1 [Bombus pascuorum]|uniref:dynein beta chain, ciliary-like isoform X1 n=1 Tax=Bombus pascuorum TaxID=65598 RepID=UPI002135B23C|nr:dynein beta chain, ciliary-like isoform X1 [Bombus pascuorum]XP_060831061.1 dynein beta chain, ciliary-like isoform X1 [Bombus pascuorum]XP_060831065.1 dynein beta chain, ciliary-like isoform X1 [Bombus pascuorum]XP_060831066.1 dynein beta chain, ciliary-like isoform X1 [Bombus pascuorum]XP_060831067.1 dynein beta chain, ciliary-like isoform X1 [Bombus pascuorum]
MLELYSKVEDRTPFVTVALQECERMNLLCEELRRSLQELELGLKGELTINPEMEDLQNYIMMDAVPPSWTKRAYPSELGLNSWFTDMLYRINELSNWTADFNFVKLIIEFVANFHAWNSTQTDKINIGKLNERQNKTSFNAHDCFYA